MTSYKLPASSPQPGSQQFLFVGEGPKMVPSPMPAARATWLVVTAAIEIS
jgi:hypothetical protein